LSTQSPHTLLALASYEKGHAFLRQAKQEGVRVFLLTSLSLKDTAQWPRDCLDDIFYMPDEGKIWNLDDTLKAVSYLARTERIDRIVPLDDFDLEKAATLREHLRLPGLGESATRHFRDKLAMRTTAARAGIRVPDFVHVLHHPSLAAFIERVPAPWVLKPRSSAGAMGIKKVHSAEELWDIVHSLGDERSQYLLERYVPGAIYHVDTIVYNSEIRFNVASGYGRPPMDVAHGGGVFTTQLLERGSALEQDLLALNRDVLAALGLPLGVAHTEFIAGHDGPPLLPRNRRPRRRRPHRRPRRSRHRHQPLGRMGPRRNRRRRGGLPTAARPRRLRRPPRLPRPAGIPRHLRLHRPRNRLAPRQEKPRRLHRPLRRRERVSEVIDSLTARVQQDFWAFAPARERPTE
jgi:hypothetical protein